MKLNSVLKRKLLAFVYLLFFASCNKGNVESVFPFQLKVSSIESQSEIRLFTNGGEVKDEVIISKYIGGVNSFNMSLNDIQSQANVSFMSKEKANLGGLIQNVEQKDNNELIFSGSVILDDRPFSYSYKTLYSLGKNNLPLEYSSQVSGVKRYTGKEIRIAQGDHHSFTLPITSYKLRRGGYSVVEGNPISIYFTDLETEHGGSVNSGSRSTGWFYNDFNEEFLSSLTDTDTIAVQVTYVKFSK